jgi:hypothetical protein
LGQNDKIFPADGAAPYLRDLPDAELHLLDTGHFALKDKLDVMAAQSTTVSTAKSRHADARWPIREIQDKTPFLQGRLHTSYSSGTGAPRLPCCIFAQRPVGAAKP